ncbi:hypothetical protein JCM3766R1_002400 [Sporobolomyces carnicolor]
MHDNAQDLATRTIEGARPLRSKKQRPCDRCRQRKSRCAIDRFGQPCTECSQTGNACTFLLPPPTRPKRDSVPTFLDAPPPPHLPNPLNVTSPVAPFQASREQQNVGSVSPSIDLARSDQRPAKRLRSDGGRDPSPDRSLDRSLDRDLPSNVEYSAITATLTDDLLTTHDGVGPPRKMVSSRGHSTFVTFARTPNHRFPCEELEISTLRQIRSFCAFAVPGQDEGSLIDQYYNRNVPGCPVLSRSLPYDDLPPGLQAVVLVEAIAAVPQSRLAGQEARRMVKATKLADRMLESSAELSSISAALLELNMNLDPRGDYMLLSKTIAHAQLLGLHIDCRGWSIPDWEQDLRSSLWWSIRIQDAWSSFLNSRPSHLQQGNTSVPLPRFAAEGESSDGIAFACACRLSTVVARLQQEVSTLDRYGSSQRIDSCDSIEADLNTMKEGLQGYFDVPLERQPGLDAVLFLLLALRCMVRRISIEIRIGIGSSFSPDQSTLSIFSELVLFVKRLDSDARLPSYDWPGYASHVFSSVLSSLVRLSLAYTANAPSTHRSSMSPPVTLLAQLVHSLKRLRPSFDLVETALVRATNVISRLTEASSSDFDTIVDALRGSAPSPPPQEPTLLLETLASLAAEPSLGPGIDSDAVADNSDTLGDVESWMSVLDQRPLWEELGGIDWNLFA